MNRDELQDQWNFVVLMMGTFLLILSNMSGLFDQIGLRQDRGIMDDDAIWLEDDVKRTEFVHYAKINALFACQSEDPERIEKHSDSITFIGSESNWEEVNKFKVINSYLTSSDLDGRHHLAGWILVKDVDEDNDLPCNMGYVRKEYFYPG